MADNTTRYRGTATGGGGFSAYGAGTKRYGGGRSMPNLGPVGNKAGYAQRDREEAAKRNLRLKRMQRDLGMKFEIM